MYNNFFVTYSIEPPAVFKEPLELKEQKFIKPLISDFGDFSNFGKLNEFDLQSPYTSTFDPTILSVSNFQIAEPISITKNVIKGPKEFEKVLDEAEKINPEVRLYREFLTRTAKRESGFNSYILNKNGAPYYGYFLMGRREIKTTTGLSVEEFRNNPVLQVLGAVKLYKINLKTMKAIGIYSLGRKKGYTDDALVSGAWSGGAGGVKTYLLGKGDPSDYHWGPGGTSVGRVMNDWMRNV